MRIRFTLLSFFIVVMCAKIAAPSDGKTLRSEKGHFAFTCPTIWRVREDGQKTFEIINFPESEILKGVGLSKRGASITVVRAPANIASIENWLARDAARFGVKGQHVIDLTHLAHSSCKRVTKAEWDSEVGPNTLTHQTSLYCQTDEQLFRIELTNWSDDPKQKDLQQTVLEIAASFKSW